MSFSTQFLQEVKERNPIEEAVTRFVPLKRAGSNLVGICPFHSEKSPSFTVFPGTQSFYCFGCGAGGDVVTFVMQTEGLDYREAVEALAKRAGIQPEEDPSFVRTAEPVIKKSRIIEATRAAGLFFYTSLVGPDGETAREYLKKRELSAATIKRFGIGYAPDSWNKLTDHLHAKGFTDAELTAAFLSAKSAKNGRLYDIFRHRIMFPVFNLEGEPIAFSGRRIRDEEERKYINTSDTPAFKKSKILFCMNIAKNEGSGTLILCEGGVDAIALQQAGFSNAVATLGTAITPEHARLMARFVKTVYIAYDIDKAGRTATDKAIRILGEAGVSTRIINMGTDAKDPDEFVKKFGKDAFRRCLEGSSGEIEYTIDTTLAKYALTVPDERLRAANALYDIIAALSNRTEREIYASTVAARLSLSRETTVSEIERRAARLREKQKEKAISKQLQKAEGYGDRVNPDKLKFSSAALIEERLLGLMLIRPESTAEAVKQLDSSDFITAFNRKVYELFLPEFQSGAAASISKDGVLTPEEIGAVSRMMASRLQLKENTDDDIFFLIQKLKEERLKRENDEKLATGDVNELEKYITSLRERNKKHE